MEFLGSSLYLPLTEESLQAIELSLMIYKTWLGLSCSEAWKLVVPECLRQNQQWVFREITKQLSIIFEERTVPSMNYIVNRLLYRGAG